MEPHRLQAAKGLLKHSLFGFQVYDTAISERLGELKELLLATCGEMDQIALLSESIRGIKQQLQSRSENFLLEPLRRFEQDMELLLDVWSGDDVEDQHEDLIDDETETCLSLSQDSVDTLTTPQSSPTRSIQVTRTHQMIVEDEALRCGVCWAHDSLENDPIVCCGVCGVAVHQTCYRLAVVPQGDWYCIPCKSYMDSHAIKSNLLPTREIECEACCLKGGAMVPTVGTGWVHVACLMFLPELLMQDKHASRCQGLLDNFEVVCGVDKLKARRKLRCCFCKKNYAKGACAQCAVGRCTVAYHALCALQNGIKLRYLNNQEQFGSGCHKHQAEFLSMHTFDESAVAMVKNTVQQKIHDTDSIMSCKTPWSNSGASGSDGVKEADINFDSDHDGSHYLHTENISSDDDNHKYMAQPILTTVSPPRLFGARVLRNSGKIQFKRHKSKHSFATADGMPDHCVDKAYASPNSRFSTQNAAVDSSVSSRKSALSSKAKNDDTDNELVLQADVFAPLFHHLTDGPDNIGKQAFNYVMVLIHSRPLGLGIASSKHGTGIFLLAKKTRNLSVIAALKRGVLQDGDEIYALNDLMLRNTRFSSFKDEVVPSVSLPVRCWFRTRRKRKSAATGFQLQSANNATTTQPVSVDLTSTTAPREQQCDIPSATTSPHIEIVDHYIDFTSFSPNVRNDVAETASLDIDWPWVFLRSDGKVAMNLFWKSLDSAFFHRKISKRTFSQLQERTENTSGVRLSSTHSKYKQVSELLLMPRRERLPVYLVEYRKKVKQKQMCLTSDVLIGISSKPKDAEAEVDEQSLLEVGTTVNVVKRTWPGMNKLGGVGRIKNVNKTVSSNGKSCFTYNIAYVLSGTEKNVERKYICVVDLEADDIVKNQETCPIPSSRRHRSEKETNPKNAEDEKTDIVNARLIFAISCTEDKAQLPSLPDVQFESLPNQQRFQLQFTIDNSAVRCERKTQPSGLAPPTQELLLHRYFPIKVADALINEYFLATLLGVEDRVGYDADEDGSDSDDDAGEIKTKLTAFQNHLFSVVESNESALASLTEKIKKEYASKVYRQQVLKDIEWRNYERMYQELQDANCQFVESDEESDLGEDERQSGFPANAKSTGETNSESEDISFESMFVEQEGSEVCTLCELSGGDFARTESGSVVHLQCALFTPETFFKSGVVHGLNLVDPKRRQLKCVICGGRKGQSKVQCAYRKCARAYHVSCAFVNGLLTRDPYYQVWCPRHLKTSGMSQFVEVPDHLNKHRNPPAPLLTSNEALNKAPPFSRSQHGKKKSNQRPSHQKKSRNVIDTTPREAVIAVQENISSSKSNRKRKSSTSSKASVSSVKTARVTRTRGKCPRSAFVSNGKEARCARRLDIGLSDESDHERKAVDAWQQGRDSQHVSVKGSVVEVLARDWRGVNKPGGVARVRDVKVIENKNGTTDVFYDIVHIVGAFKEKSVPAQFVRSYQN